MAFDITAAYNVVSDACGNKYYEQTGLYYRPYSPYSQTSLSACPADSGQDEDQFPASSIRIATLGDSTAGFATPASGAELYASAAITPNAKSSERLAGWLPFFSGGLIRPVYDCGVSGETTTQIAARAVALTGGTKPLVDAATVYSCHGVVITGGINDISAFTTATAESTITTAVNLAITNIKTCVNAAKSLGIYAWYQSILPYGESPLTANQLVVAAAAERINSGIAGWLSYIPDVGEYYNARSFVSESDGGWKVGYHDTAIPSPHPNHTACYAAYQGLAERIVARMGNMTYRQGLPKGQNMWNNADMSSSAAGLATGITVASGTPTTSLVEWRGVTAQQFLHAAGVISSAVDITFSAAGAAPFVPVAINDILAAEFDLYIDDNAGGAPELYSVVPYLRKSVGTTPTIYDIGMSWPGGSSTDNYDRPLDGKVIAGHILIDEATGASSGSIFIRLTIISNGATTKSVRVIISNVRIVKITSSY